MEKIINSIKKIIFGILPPNRELNGNEFQRGQQLLAMQIADIIDPVNNDNIEPNYNLNEGEVLYQGLLMSKKAQKLGVRIPVLGFDNDDINIVTRIKYVNELNGKYEIIIRKTKDENDKHDKPEKNDNPQPKLADNYPPADYQPDDYEIRFVEPRKYNYFYQINQMNNIEDIIGNM